MTNLIDISAADCLPFSNQDQSDFEIAIRGFLEAEKEISILSFSKNRIESDEDHLVEFDYLTRQWRAGRYVGEALIPVKEKMFRFRIQPRFGKVFLFRLLEEVFQIKFTKSFNSIERKKQNQNYIKQIIAFIWFQKLANANKHGIPKTNQKITHKGVNVKGRINVRKSINPFFRSKELVSQFNQKQPDEVVAQILIQAYRILKKDYHVGNFKLQENAQEAIFELERSVKTSRFLTENDFRKIKLKAIYASFRPVLDLSWDIIKPKRLSTKNTQKNRKGESFFIDMAELWEIYIRSLLKKHLKKSGWQVYSKGWKSYPNQFYGRTLIPDIIAEKEGKYLIWDAKYKLMKGRKQDVDRSDFFQIHTYLQFYMGNKEVIAGGLLYPLSDSLVQEKSNSDRLLSEFGPQVKFGIDGIDLSFLSDWEGSDLEARERLIQNENEFIARFEQYISREVQLVP